MKPVVSERTRPPEAASHFLRIGEIRPTGWIRQQLGQDLTGFVGTFRQICSEAASDIFVSGRVAGGDERHWWNGETEGKWIDGLVRVAHVLGDARAQADIRDYLDRIIAHQEADGYLGIYTKSWRDGGNRCIGDLWTLSLLLLALLAQHEATAEPRYLDSALRAAHSALRRHGPGGGDPPCTGPAADSMVLGHNLLIVEPLVWLHQLTNDGTLLDFAIWCYEQFSEADLGWPESDGQLAKMSDPAIPFIGHGAHTCAQLRIPLLLFAATGEERYQRAYQVGYQKIFDCVGVSGACKSDECIGSPLDPGAPLPETGYEYCTMTELAHSLHYALRWTGEMTYADRAERLILNAAQASRTHDGRAIAYVGADNQYVAAKSVGPRWDYSPTHDDVAVCCNPSAARLLGHHVSRMVMRTEDDGLLVAFYGPLEVETTVRATSVRLVMTTEFPFAETILVSFEAAEPLSFPLRFRVPEWSTAMTVVTPDGSVHRDGDIVTVDLRDSRLARIEIRMETRVRALRAVDGTIAVERGPLVYALEVPTQGHVTRTYALDDYHDTDYTPATGARWDFTLRIDTRRRDLGLAFVADEQDGDGFPWSTPPLRILAPALDPTASLEYWAEMGTELTLVPLGSTTLRRTCFTYVSEPADRSSERIVRSLPRRKPDR